MDVFAFRDFLVKDYERFTRSFVQIRAEDIKRHVDGEYAAGRFWPCLLYTSVSTNAAVRSLAHDIYYISLQKDHKGWLDGRARTDRPGSRLAPAMDAEPAAFIARQSG